MYLAPHLEEPKSMKYIFSDIDKLEEPTAECSETRQ